MDQGVKINQKVYRRDIFKVVVLPWVQQHFSTQIGRFNRTRRRLTRQKRPIFQTSTRRRNGGLTRWPQPDGLQRVVRLRAQGLCYAPQKFIDALKQSVHLKWESGEWDRLSPEDLQSIAENFKSTLDLCIATGEGHFETGSIYYKLPFFVVSRTWTKLWYPDILHQWFQVTLFI